ncbi:glycosyl transferase, partial [Aphelenchoides avenae]
WHDLKEPCSSLIGTITPSRCSPRKEQTAPRVKEEVDLKNGSPHSRTHGKASGDAKRTKASASRTPCTRTSSGGGASERWSSTTSRRSTIGTQMRNALFIFAYYRTVVEKFTNADRCALYGRYFPYANWAQWKDADGECVNEITRGVMEANNLFAQEVDPGRQELRDNRPFLLVSSTSWTEDEDFGILLDAVEEYERVAKVRANGIVEERLPKLFVVITGKGPLKAFYMERVAKMNTKLRNAHITSAWLAAEDYPRLLASADLGVCLHTSTS